MLIAYEWDAVNSIYIKFYNNNVYKHFYLLYKYINNNNNNNNNNSNDDVIYLKNCILCSLYLFQDDVIHKLNS